MRLDRLEEGLRSFPVDDACRCLDEVGAPPEFYDRVVEADWQADGDLLAHRHLPAGPDAVWMVLRCESEASAVIVFDPTAVPSLAQTREYARVLLDTSDAGAWVEARMHRQRILSEPLTREFEFLVPEAALRAVVGDHGVMEDQLLRLAELAGREDVTVRVVPAGTPGAAWSRGQFTLMEHDSYPTVAHLELDTASLLLDRPDDIAVYRDRVHSIRAAALEGERSREFLYDLTDWYGKRRGMNVADAK
ncbi:DUF5753 domain-containing protein [Actinosynnema sp. NPDC020468]|uniref:DUF5753 domain-containing protein n=1 Tax=Actinosynnema sp. NPDC020468 TaxID=3154488 RepID=UPI0033D50672